ncbi:assimilatory nitrite reductase large subunit [Xenophilus aerolatus]|nr:assimilatory nitrite reductase large subunit [Xenophilus aerolatus]
MRKMKLVVVGNGMAGMRTVEELLRLAPGLYEITVFGAEPHPNYNRILLSPVLAGEKTIEQIVLHPRDWYVRHGITLHTGCRVRAVDRTRRTVRAEADDGRVVEAAYDRLLLATGSSPFMLPVPGADLQGVIAYRDIADTEAMIAAARTQRRAVVIGGGVLGLEAANGLAQRGMQVTVVHTNAWPMDKQLDAEAGALLQRALEGRGIAFRLRTHTESLQGDGGGRVRAVRFSDGSEVHADLVVMAVGIRPNVALAKQMRLHCERGVVVDDTLQTVTDPRIYAVGECAQHRGIAYGLVAPLYEQGRVAATHLAQMGIGRYGGSLTPLRLKVTGIELFSAGDFMGGEGSETIVLRDPAGGIYRKLVLQDDRLVGVCLYGDAAEGSWYLDLMRERRNVADLRDQLMFGPPAPPAAPVAEIVTTVTSLARAQALRALAAECET